MTDPAPRDLDIRTWSLAGSSVPFDPEMRVYQFLSLLHATEYNAREAAKDQSGDAKYACATNALLTAYSALEALVLETAFILQPALYGITNFRNDGLPQKFRRYLDAAGRPGEQLPAVIGEIAAHRRALTHSEPNNPRSFMLWQVISAPDAARLAAQLRTVAEWLWQSTRPGHVARDFDGPNYTLPDD